MIKKQSKKTVVMDRDTKIVSQVGDVWLLNQHRLMCGDSTDIHQVKKLMATQKADMAFIDPPYNVNYQGGHKAPRKKIKNDHLTHEEFTQFLDELIAVHQKVLKRGASLYICYSFRYQRIFQYALEKNNFEIRNQIVWAKNNASNCFGRYRSKHEVIFYCHHKKERDPWYGDRKQTTVWQIPKPAANKWHPTMKPMALIEKALINSSKKDDLIVDLCGGSGSTLMACEELDRYACLMEIEPCYVDATIQRWQLMTKQPAILASNQVPYDELLAQLQAK